MYPANYFSLFPPFGRDDRCFVAMSFDSRFDRRWDIIATTIAREREDLPSLTAHRIDLSRRGDSILTEILDEVARCRLIVADVSTAATVDGRPVRNANVLYEVGLAHSVRMPEEVILIRSDDDPLPFDIANVRVHSYSPDTDPDGAASMLDYLIVDGLRSVDRVRSATVERTARVLDFECWDALHDIALDGDIGHPGRVDVVAQKMGLLQALPRIAAIQRLLELGAISTSYQSITARHVGGYSELPRQDLFRYRMTPFGEALLIFSLGQMNYDSEEARAAFAALRDDDEGGRGSDKAAASPGTLGRLSSIAKTLMQMGRVRAHKTADRKV
ncbi:MAG: hypothetical protein ACR2L6_11005 [Gemmatimonadaceae bacterium]